MGFAPSAATEMYVPILLWLQDLSLELHLQIFSSELA
jgi:hypothetical protein